LVNLFDVKLHFISRMLTNDVIDTIDCRSELKFCRSHGSKYV